MEAGFNCSYREKMWREGRSMKAFSLVYRRDPRSEAWMRVLNNGLLYPKLSAFGHIEILGLMKFSNWNNKATTRGSPDPLITRLIHDWLFQCEQYKRLLNGSIYRLSPETQNKNYLVKITFISDTGLKWRRWAGRRTANLLLGII